VAAFGNGLETLGCERDWTQARMASPHLAALGVDHVKQNEIAEAKVRTAQGGELLAVLKSPASTAVTRRDSGELAPKKVSRDATVLPEGFTRAMSSRWQALARGA
jgi:hypothetical protein